MVTPETYAGVTAHIGTSIAAAREVGRPDPTDDQLFFGLAADGFAAGDIGECFAAAKASALRVLRAGAEASALVAVCAAVAIWSGIGAGVI